MLRQELLNPALLKRFSDERKILAGLNHAGICHFIDAGTLSNGTPFVVMELVEGHSLLEYCDLQKLAISQRLKLFQKVLVAVTYAHQHLVVHRDFVKKRIIEALREEIILAVPESIRKNKSANVVPV